MADRELRLRADLVERFEKMAHDQGRTADDLFEAMIELFPKAKNPKNNWLLELSYAMEAADIDWIDDSDASEHSHERFEQYLGELAEQKKSNWAAAVAKRMEEADIDWIDDPDASTNSRENYKKHLKEKWERTQGSDTE